MKAIFKRKYAINRHKKKHMHLSQSKQRKSLKRGFHHARGDVLSNFGLGRSNTNWKLGSGK